MLLDQTIGGATLGAGAHGSSPMDGTLADLVEEVMLVASDGRLLTLNEAEGDHGTNVMSLRAVRISLGLLGIAVSLTLRCTDARGEHRTGAPAGRAGVVVGGRGGAGGALRTEAPAGRAGVVG